MSTMVSCQSTNAFNHLISLSKITSVRVVTGLTCSGVCKVLKFNKEWLIFCVDALPYKITPVVENDLLFSNRAICLFLYCNIYRRKKNIARSVFSNIEQAYLTGTAHFFLTGLVPQVFIPIQLFHWRFKNCLYKEFYVWNQADQLQEESWP